LAVVVLRHQRCLATILFSQQLLLLAAEEAAAIQEQTQLLVVLAAGRREIHWGRGAVVTRHQPHQVKVVMAAQPLKTPTHTVLVEVEVPLTPVMVVAVLTEVLVVQEQHLQSAERL
tara:strand:+ start:215 stop:562 length:348 start_codon:yes stop_codon:yes gene_type:complete